MYMLAALRGKWGRRVAPSFLQFAFDQLVLGSTAPHKAGRKKERVGSFSREHSFSLKYSSTVGVNFKETFSVHRC